MLIAMRLDPSSGRRYLRDAVAEAQCEYPPPPQLLERSDGRQTSEALCSLIAQLVPRLVRRTIQEDGLGCTVLVFLATYTMIEQAPS